MRKTKIILLAVLLWCAGQVAVAAVKTDDIKIAISGGASFTKGQTPEFTYKITNNSTATVKVEYTATLNCQQAPQKMLALKTKELAPGKSLEEKYADFKINAGINTQTCLAQVAVNSPVAKKAVKAIQINNEAAAKAKIEAAGSAVCPSDLKSFIKVNSCVTDKKNIFLKGDVIYLNPIFSKAIGKATVSNQLFYPNGQATIVNLPLTLVATEVGSYRLETTVSEGETKTTYDMNFSVLAQKPIINWSTTSQSATISQTTTSQTIFNQMTVSSSTTSDKTIMSVTDRLKQFMQNSQASDSGVDASGTSDKSNTTSQIILPTASATTIDDGPIFKKIVK